MPNEAIKPLARSTDLVTKEVADEVLIYDLKTHKAHCLNKTAFLAWSYCDGETSIAEIANRMTTESAASVSEDVVWLAINQLGKVNLLEGDIQQPTRHKVSRRDALRRIAAGGAIALPLVMTVIAPVAAQAATCRSVSPANYCTTGAPGGCNSNVSGSRPNGCRCGSSNQCCSGRCSNVPNDGCENPVCN